MSETIEDQGFENEAELHKMVASIDISNPDALKKFKKWQQNDGSKEGLQKIIDQQTNDYE